MTIQYEIFVLYFLLHLYNRQFEIYVSSVGLVRELPSIKNQVSQSRIRVFPFLREPMRKTESERRLENECKKSND